uniref:Uncharacterized protein n=1 Tax=Anguilla anguilla TaxID=7936 RepID=A0A0E9QUY7_ANGAN
MYDFSMNSETTCSLAITETWLSDGDLDTEVAIDGLVRLCASTEMPV